MRGIIRNVRGAARSIRTRATTFGKAERGAVLVMAAAGIFGSAAFAGLALDYGKVALDRRAVQNGVDASALAGAQEVLAGGTARAVYGSSQTWLDKNGLDTGDYLSDIYYPPVSGAYAGNTDCVQVDTDHTVDGFMMPIGEKSVKANAVACQDHDWRKYSILTLNPTACGSFRMAGNVHMWFEGAGTYNNSECATATILEGNNTLISAENRVVGGAQILGTSDVSPDFEAGPHIQDPLKSLARPGGVTAPVQTCPNLSGAGGGNVTLNPGRYNCTINTTGGTWRVTFKPGAYEITGGIVGDGSGDRYTFQGGTVILGGQGLRMTGSARLTANGTMFYINTGGCVSLNGDSTLTANAPTSGTYQGILIFQARDNTCGVSLNGNAAAGNQGLIYAPAAKITYSGNVDSKLQFISDTFSATGGGCGTTYWQSTYTTDVRVVRLKE